MLTKNYGKIQIFGISVEKMMEVVAVVMKRKINEKIFFEFRAQSFQASPQHKHLNNSEQKQST